MFGFGYALVPMYKTICDALGINVLSLSDQRTGLTGSGSGTKRPANTQVDKHPAGDGGVRRQRARALGLQARACVRCRCTRASWPR